jgi:hypothetical protein
MAVKMSMLLFCVVTPLWTYSVSGSSPEDGDSMFFRSFGIYQKSTLHYCPEENHRQTVRFNSKHFRGIVCAVDRGMFSWWNARPIHLIAL